MEFIMTHWVFMASLLIFVVTFGLIITEAIPGVVAAMSGGLLMIMIRIMSEEKAFEAIDLGTVFLLIGMMIIVHITSETGVFQWIAIKMGKIAKGEPFIIMALLVIATAFLSAFLDNVTTVLLIAPVSIMIAEQLEISPVPYLIAEAMASNVGGTATLIGDPPNILIGNSAGLSFNSFIMNSTPIAIINLIVFIATMWFIFGRKMKVSRDLKARILELDSSRAITNKKLLKKSLIVLAIVIFGFFTHNITELSPAIIAISGGMLLLLISGHKPADVLKHMEWDTIFFFIGLFMLVQGVVEVGAIKMLADGALKLTNGDLKITSMLILWMSGILSSFVNNVPYAVTIIPMIKEMIPQIHGINPAIAENVIANALWWPLVLGACLGGNGTLVGASANVICAGMGTKSGYKISFMEFTKYGILIMIQSMIICTIYVWFRYLR